jgi:hypothetical protein
MDERVRFVARSLAGRGENGGSLSRVRYLSQNRLQDPVEAAILNLKREKPYWGARKIREPLMASLLLLLDLSVTYPRYLQWVAVLD